MIHLSNAHEEHVRELLQGSDYPRDQLPYADEFAVLKEEFYKRTFKPLTDAEFWQVLLAVGKKGGVRGKKTVEPAPELTEEEKHILRRVVGGALGEIDRLPYSDRMEQIARRFSSAVERDFTARQVWLALLALRK